MNDPHHHSTPPERPTLSPYELGPRSVARRWAKAIQVGFVLLFLTVLVGVAAKEFAARRDPLRPVIADETNAAAPSQQIDADSPLFAPPWVSREQKIARDHDLEAAKILQRDFLALVDRLAAELNAWQRELDQWHGQVDALLNNDLGRALAADPKLAATFRALYEQERPGGDRLDSIRSEMQRGLDTVRRASADEENALRPDAALTERLQSFYTEATAATHAWRDAHASIRELVARVEGQATNLGRSLADVIAEDRRADQLRREETIRVAAEKARREADARVAEANAEKIRAEGELEANRIRTQTEAARQRQADEEARARKTAEHAALKAALERDMADVRRYLAPFTARGYAQPSGYFCEQTAAAGPMSYSKIAAAGALKKTREGMQLLVNYATRGNDRDRAGFPTCNGSPSEWEALDKEYVRRAQELLSKYGDLLVEQGMLAP
jgi:hypothetical protein